MQKMELARLEHLESPCFSRRWGGVRNREILSPFLGPRVSERGKYVFSFFWRLFSLPFCLYFPPPHLSVFRTRMRRRRRFMRVRFVSFSWVLASTPGTTGFRGLPERKREKERIYCYSRRVRRQRRTASTFLVFPLLRLGLSPRLWGWIDNIPGLASRRICGAGEYCKKSFYCLPRPVVAKRQTQSSVGVGTRCDIPPALG